jgi:hypothetical protein
MLNMARYNDVFLDSQYENGSQGTAFEYELVYYPSTTTGGPEGLKRPNPDNVAGESIRGLGDDKELYRWHYLIKNNRRQDDYRQIIEALTAIGGRATDPGYHDRVNELLDVDQWLRSFAVQSLAGIGDNYANGAQHNGIFYARPDGKTLYLPWDLDFSFTESVTGALVNNAELRKFVANPTHEHNYYGHVYDMLQTTYKSEYMDRWVDHFDALVPRQNYSGFKAFISRRATSALQQIERAIPRVPFEITTAGPIDAGSSLSVPLTGTGWVDVRTIRLKDGDIPMDLVWTTDSQWQVNLPLDTGSKEYTLEAYDFQGKLVTADTVTVTTTGVSPVRNGLRITEVHYNPADAVTGEANVDNDEFEFVELINIGAAPIELQGVRLVEIQVGAETHGIDFMFGAGSLGPNERIVVANNRSSFVSRYGDRIRIAAGGSDDGDGYAGRLDNGGETLVLMDSTGARIQRFVYEDTWYSLTDGRGHSLELLNPTADVGTWNAVASWLPSGPTGGTPGRDIALIGDANLDGVFDSSDFILVLQAGEYEDSIPGNSVWADGDWNRDGEFTSRDLVVAFQLGMYRSLIAPFAVAGGGQAADAVFSSARTAGRHSATVDGTRTDPVDRVMQPRERRAAALSGISVDSVFQQYGSRSWSVEKDDDKLV